MEDIDFLPPTAPSLVFARETYTPYCGCDVLSTHDFIVNVYVFLCNPCIKTLKPLSKKPQTESFLDIELRQRWDGCKPGI